MGLINTEPTKKPFPITSENNTEPMTIRNDSKSYGKKENVTKAQSDLNCKTNIELIPKPPDDEKLEHKKTPSRPKRKVTIKSNKNTTEPIHRKKSNTTVKDLKESVVDSLNRNEISKDKLNLIEPNEAKSSMSPLNYSEEIPNLDVTKTNKKSLDTIKATNRRATRTSLKNKLTELVQIGNSQTIKVNTQNENLSDVSLRKEFIESIVFPKNTDNIEALVPSKKTIPNEKCKKSSDSKLRVTVPVKTKDSIEKPCIVRRSTRHKIVGENLSDNQYKLSNNNPVQNELEGEVLVRKEVDDILASFLNDDENIILQDSSELDSINRPTRIEESIDLLGSDINDLSEWNSVDIHSYDNIISNSKEQDSNFTTIRRICRRNRDGSQTKSANEIDSIEIEDSISVTTSETKNVDDVVDKHLFSLKDENSCSSSATGNTSSSVKKQRRRRKNELAAIVADQLLESFKEVDQSRIDDLKLLENLAYEKNEDLLLTGMRLTPTTKRKSFKVIKNSVNEKNTLESKGDKKSETVQNVTTQQLKCSTSKLIPKSKESSESFTSLGIPREKTSDKNIVAAKKNILKDNKKSSTKLKQVDDFVVKPKRRKSIITELLGKKETEEVLEPKNEESTFKKTIDTIKPQDKPKLSNFTGKFDVYRTFKNSFQTFRSLDFGFNKTHKPKADNMSKLLELPEFSIPLPISEETKELKLKGSDANEKKFTSLHKKLRKKLSKKKDKNSSESENINQVRSVLESFTFGKGDQSTNPESKSLIGNAPTSINTSGGGLFSTQIRSHISVPPLKLGNKLNNAGEQKKVLILRPSILSATLDTPIITPARLTDSTGSVALSRDPRLNKNIHAEDRKKSPDLAQKNEQRRLGSIRQRRKSESLGLLSSTREDELNSAILYPRERLRSSSRRAAAAVKQQIKTDAQLKINQIEEPPELSDEEDNYLALIAKNVNEKIMSAEDKDFNPANDGFELANQFLGNNEPFSRPSTSLSTCSAPNFNDEASNMTLNENTNNDLLDMDLDDDISIYTSFSQDVSRLRGRGKYGGRRRRRRSILLPRRSRKTSTNTLNPNQTYDCKLCLKSFTKASTLTKHQITITHISKVSEQEYLIATRAQRKEEEPKLITKTALNKNLETNEIDILLDHSGKDQMLEKKLTRLILKDVPMSKPLNQNEEIISSEKYCSQKLNTTAAILPTLVTKSSILLQEKHNLITLPSSSLLNQSGIEPISSPEPNDLYPTNSSSRLTLNPDERLFYECCNILKGSETPQVERTYTAMSSTRYVYDVPKSIAPKLSEHFNQPALIARRGNFAHPSCNPPAVISKCTSPTRTAYPRIDINQFSDISSDSSPAKASVTTYKTPYSALPSQFTDTSVNKNQRNELFYGVECPSSQVSLKQCTPPEMTARIFVNQPSQSVHPDQKQSCCGDGNLQQRQVFTSPIHSTSSQGSTLTTATTCRLKTKAAMKGYDNLKVSIPTIGLDMQQALERSPHGCKLTALAEIALGNEAPKTNITASNRGGEDHERGNKKFSEKYQELTTSKEKKSDSENTKEPQMKSTDETEQHDKEKDIYDFEESQDEIIEITVPKQVEKIIIPDRPFKNIGLDEQQTIKFQKPETFVQNEESVMSIISYSDRDDFNYGSLSDGGDDDVDHDKNVDYLNNEGQDCTDISSNSSAVTAKTFENKSLIMGRIFNKKATARVKFDEKLPTIKVIEPSKKHIPKQDLDRLFDKLRGFDDIPKEYSTVDIEASKKKDIAIDKTQNSEKKKAIAGKVSKNKNNKTTCENKMKRTESVENKSVKSKKSVKIVEKSKALKKRKAETSFANGDVLQMINDDGQRKSQRRCTANRSKKLVEMWSSDEYEEFLSTNDIIALIEEKEKVDNEKKKKPFTETTTTLKKSEKTDELVKHPSTAKLQEIKENTKDKKTIKSIKCNKNPERSQLKKESQNRHKDDNIRKTKPKLIEQNIEKHSTKTQKKKNTVKDDCITQKKSQSTSKTRNKIPIIESESEFEEDSTKKSSVRRRKAIAFKDETKIKQKKLNKSHSKKATISKTNKTNKQVVNKLSNTSKPMSRRKRIASEMLYYWSSSSSDEEFGRIESPRDDEDDLVDEIGENYQQHGWIVGDSHKKLVTLLAIAKGTKKVDDCGVKQTKKK